MKISAVRVVSFLFGIGLMLLASGCGGGWGGLKPVVGLPAGESQSQTVLVGQTATFTVTASGTGPFQFQWYEDGKAITGATGISYTTPPTTSGDSGEVFTVSVTNAAGTVMSPAFTLTVVIPPAITEPPASQTVIAGQTATFTVVATGTAPLAYQWYQGSTAISGAKVETFTTPATDLSNNGETFFVTVSNLAGSVTSRPATLTVVPEKPVLTWATIPSETYGNPPFKVSASSASSGAVTYSVVSGPATISGSTVTLTGLGTVTLQANQAAAGNYAAATATTSFTVAGLTPTLTWATIPAESYGNAPFTVSASSASSGAITYSVVSGPATISGSTVTLTGAGTVTLQASQAAAGNYGPATAPTTFTVAGENPNLTWTAIPTQIYGVAPFGVSASSASSGAITYSVVSGPATISGSTVTITGVGTVNLLASQAAAGNYAAATAPTSFAVTANVAITPISPANATTGTAPQTFTATASGGPTNALTWSASAGTITSGGVWTPPNTPGTYTITATSVDNPADYVTTTATISAPVITAQPVSQNVCVGYNASLTIAASYATSYQWYMGESLVGSSPTLSFNNVTTANNGSYDCVVSNGAGSVTSNTVVLNAQAGSTPTITRQPASVSVYITQTATFSVGVAGTGAMTYQWYTGTPGSGTAISGATTDSYTTGALTTADNGTSYYVTATDGNCTSTTLTSSAATLTVSDTDTALPPTIIVQPAGQTASVGGSATFTVVADGSGTLAYQWYEVPYSSSMPTTAGTAIPGATGSSYTVPSSATAQSDDGDEYYVLITNGYGSAESNRAVLAVGSGILLQITGQPVSQYIAVDAVATFNVTATCTGCIPAYQWYWFAPGSTTAQPLSDGAVSIGDFSGATVSGSATSLLTLANVPSTASASIFYAVVTSTSDGSTQISGTNPLTSNNAGLFVGALPSVGNPASGEGLCNFGTGNWVLNGTNPGTSSGDVPYQNTSACTIELTNDGSSEHAAVYWPSLISTANFTASFTVALSAGSQVADGFTLILADPSEGATTASVGRSGEGMGAAEIPGFVLGFDTFQNGNDDGGPLENTCTGRLRNLDNGACDPITVPYMAIGQGAGPLWENPWTYVNGNLNTQNSTDYSVAEFANATHAYVLTVIDGFMTFTIDGNELFAGQVSLPPVAYLGFTASTGTYKEAVTVSNLTVTVSPP
jgi:hypothetical protein